LRKHRGDRASRQRQPGVARSWRQRLRERGGECDARAVLAPAKIDFAIIADRRLAIEAALGMRVQGR